MSTPRTFDTEGVEQPWSSGEALGVGLGAIRSCALATLIPSLLILGGGAAVGFLVPRVGPLGTATPIVIAAVLGEIVFALFWGGLIRMNLAVARGEPAKLAMLWQGVRFAPRLFGYRIILLVLLVLTAPILFVGALPIALAPFAIVDENLGLVGGLRRSWRATRSTIGGLWLFHVTLSPLALLLLIVPLSMFAVVPLRDTGLAYAYVRSTGRNARPWNPPGFARRAARSYLRALFVVLLGAFGAVFLWVQRLPPVRGSLWSLKDTLIRASAIVLGVGAVLVMLALLLPWFLDWLEGRSFSSYVGARHVRSEKSGFLTVISILSICGVAISSGALSSVVSVMGGFSHDLKRKILGNNAHIVVDTTAATPFENYKETLARVRKVPNVVAATPVVHGEVMVSSASNLAGVVVNGIEPSSIGQVIELTQNIEVGSLDYLEHPNKLLDLPADEVIGVGPGGERYKKGADLLGLPDAIDPDLRTKLLAKPERPGVIVGRELAKTLHVYVGDEVTLVSPLGDLGPMGLMPRTKKFRVAAIFYSGMYEYDATYVYTMLDVAQAYFAVQGKISAIEVRAKDADNTDLVTTAVISALERPELRVRDWREINKNLFSALKLERFATFIILSIAIMVASFCIVCTLLLMVTEKGKEIAILKALGASDGSILRTFMTEGMIIGGIGTVFGVATGLALCMGLSWFGLRLDPDVYYIDRLPISVNGWDFLGVAAAAMTICTLSTIYPAYAASKLRPVDGLRYE